MHTQKIATCCYCGTRTVLQLTARHGHELACGSCGAPIHVMKPLRRDEEHPGMKKKSKRPEYKDERDRYRGKKKKKKRSPGLWKFLEEVVDVVEDIID